MPTVFFISRDEKKNSTLPIIKVVEIINQNANRSQFLTSCGYKILHHEQSQMVAILVESVYCFDTVVKQRAFDYIDDFLKEIGLREFFYISGEGSTKTKEGIDQILKQTTEQILAPQNNPIVGLSISLTAKTPELGLYRSHQAIAADMTKIGDAIHKILGKNLKIKINHDFDKEKHTFTFSLNIKNDIGLLYFKGAVVLAALKAVGLDSDYKIDDFDLNAYQELLQKITENQLPKAVEQKLEINSEDKALYEDEVLEIKCDEKDTNIDNFIKAYSLPDTSTPNIEKALRLAAKNNNVKDIQFILINFPNVNINKQDENTDSQKAALHWAVIERATDCVRVLLDRGAKWDIPDAYEKTAADYATKSNAEIQLLFASMKTVDKEAEYSNDAFQFN